MKKEKDPNPYVSYIPFIYDTMKNRIKTMNTLIELFSNFTAEISKIIQSLSDKKNNLLIGKGDDQASLQASLFKNLFSMATFQNLSSLNQFAHFIENNITIPLKLNRSRIQDQITQIQSNFNASLKILKEKQNHYNELLTLYRQRCQHLEEAPPDNLDLVNNISSSIKEVEQQIIQQKEELEKEERLFALTQESSMREFEDSEQKFYELFDTCINFYNNTIEIFTNSCSKNVELVTIEAVELALNNAPQMNINTNVDLIQSEIENEFPMPELTFDIHEFVDPKEVHT